ncbi:MAG TPA: hypothetical protein ENN11_00525 [Methanomicrobia archaeon]|nr:hypothetical protein [Methanomicrobia archaeon]
MEQEKSVTQIVTEIIDRMPLMGDYLLNNIVNYKGLARYIHPLVERRANKEVSIESISVAIQRYHFRRAPEESARLEKALSQTKLMLKNDITTVAFLKNYDLIKKIDTFSERIRWEYGETFFTVQSSQELSVVMERDRIDDFLSYTSAFEPLSVIEDVTIINCKYPAQILNIPGYLYSLLRAITMEKLNIIDIFSTYTEFVFLFKKDDALKAYDVLEQLIHDARERGALR